MSSIDKILIANRGEIALRVMRTCRAMGIGSVAIYADPDRDALFVRAADEAVCIGAPVTGSSFLAIDTILEAARRTGATAIHPGYGFLAENADFAQACGDAGLIFIGPTPEAIRRMGTKIEAKQIASVAGVPTIPGFSAAGLSDAAVAERARELGLPLLIKASAGGGGKGMRIVEDVAALASAMAAARREANAAFGDDTLLIERYIPSPRHIEIQILGDAHGNIVHCFERECSIQRRYQKIIEEAPSPLLTAEQRERMGAAAVAVARAIAYRSAGTVEFVADAAGNFYFLEVNTRLQVEHPVTEEITGIDLVRLQIEVAQGARLPFCQDDLRIRGHAIEARIYAEDPYNDFLPSTGRLLCWQAPARPGVRYESGVQSGSEVTIHYDPMLAKIIAHGATRDEARRRLTGALRDLRVHGVRNNRAFLIAVLDHPAFVAGELDTHFIARHFDLRQPQALSAADRRNAIALALWLQEQRRSHAPVLRGLPSGWRNNFSQHQWIELRCAEVTLRIEYRVHSHDDIEVLVDGAAHHATIHGCGDVSIDLSIDQRRATYDLISHDTVHYIHSGGGDSELHELPRFPSAAADEIGGGCSAPMPGRILAMRVEVGQVVKRGEVLAILEAMKMEHEVTAPHDGKISEVRVETGQQVEAGAVLVVIEAGADA